MKRGVVVGARQGPNCLLGLEIVKKGRQNIQ